MLKYLKYEAIYCLTWEVQRRQGEGFWYISLTEKDTKKKVTTTEIDKRNASISGYLLII